MFVLPTMRQPASRSARTTAACCVAGGASAKHALAMRVGRPAMSIESLTPTRGPLPPSSILSTKMKSFTVLPSVLHDRQRDVGSFLGGVIHALCGLAVILGLGEQDVGHKGLRVTVVQWEPTRLHLHHQAVPRQENVIVRRELEFVGERRVGLDGLGRDEAFPIPPKPIKANTPLAYE